MYKKFIFCILIFICLSTLVSSDILSVNSDGSGEMVLISESNIEGFFSGSPSADLGSGVITKVGVENVTIEKEKLDKVFKFPYLLILIGLLIAGYVYMKNKKKKRFLIAGKDDDEEEEIEADLEVKNEKV